MRHPCKFGVIATLFITFFTMGAKAELSGTATRTGGKLAMEVAEGIALRRITNEAAAIHQMGAEGKSLWAALKTLERQGNLSRDASHWEALRKQVELTDVPGEDIVGWVQHCAKQKQPLTQQTMTVFLGRSEVSSGDSAVTASNETPEETVLRYLPRSERTTKFKDTLLGKNRIAAIRTVVAGRILQKAYRQPETCSPNAKPYCGDNAPEAAMLWAEEATSNMKAEGDQPQFSEEFVSDFMESFPRERPRLAGEAYLPGFLTIMKMKVRPAHLQNCLIRGRPSNN